MTPLRYCRHRFPPEIIQHAIWLYGRSPHGKGALQWSDNQSVAAIYPAFDAACAAGLDEVRGSAPNYLARRGLGVNAARF